MNAYELPPLDLERIAAIWWETGFETDNWKQIANWCHGAYAVAPSREDRESWYLLGLVAWDHAGLRRPALSEVAA